MKQEQTKKKTRKERNKCDFTIFFDEIKQNTHLNFIAMTHQTNSVRHICPYKRNPI